MCLTHSPFLLSLEKERHDQKKVAFFVGLGESFGPVKKNTGVVFDKVVTNVGGGFSNETGRFTAPVDGTYIFSVTIAAQGRRRVSNNHMPVIFFLVLVIQR